MHFCIMHKGCEFTFYIVQVLVFNAAPPFPPGGFGNMPTPHEVDPQYLQDGFNIGVTGCLRCVSQVSERAFSF
jgi:hypothetical protein